MRLRARDTDRLQWCKPHKGIGDLLASVGIQSTGSVGDFGRHEIDGPTRPLLAKLADLSADRSRRL